MASKQTRKPAGDNPADAIVALMEDHKKVKALFKQFETLKGDDEAQQDEKAALVRQICTELKIHTTLEEEIFYPAVREQIEDADLMDEALVEHAGAKELVAQLEEMGPDDDLYDAKVTVLGEQIDHHVNEEEGEMFPKAKKAKVDIEGLGTQMIQRRAELKSELADADDEDDEGSPSAQRSRERGGEKRTRSPQ